MKAAELIWGLCSGDKRPMSGKHEDDAQRRQYLVLHHADFENNKANPMPALFSPGI
jgi:hypothetical protein